MDAAPTTAERTLDPPSTAGRVQQVVRDYVELTKPRVQSLLILTTISAVFGLSLIHI